MRIAILGWGSLLWEGRCGFNNLHDRWRYDGPSLKIEFSRISRKSRLGALTLVIDPVHGFPTTVAWCLSKREKIEDAVTDLRCREGTTNDNICSVRLEKLTTADAEPRETAGWIVGWAERKEARRRRLDWTKEQLREGGKEALLRRCSSSLLEDTEPGRQGEGRRVRVESTRIRADSSTIRVATRTVVLLT